MAVFEDSEGKKLLVRYEVMTTTKGKKEANELGDKIFDYVEDTLGFDCAMEIINGETDELIEDYDAEESFEAEGEPTISYWQLSKSGPFNSSEANISVDFEGRKFGGKISEFDDEGNQVFGVESFCSECRTKRAESFESPKSPALKNLSTIALLALAIFAGKRLKE